LLLTTLIVISNNNDQEGWSALQLVRAGQRPQAGKGDGAAADQVRTSSE